jgi:hypothetical protein
MSRALAYGFGLGLTVLVAAPGFGDPNWDSFPLSTYPMFARPRSMPRLFFAEGASRDGTRHRLSPSLVANDEVMQATASVRRAVSAGPAAMQALCHQIAERIAHDSRPAEGRRQAHDSRPADTAIIEVRLSSARFDPVRYFSHGPEPVERTTHERCDVPGSR